MFVVGKEYKQNGCSTIYKVIGVVDQGRIGWLRWDASRMPITYHWGEEWSEYKLPVTYKRDVLWLRRRGIVTAYIHSEGYGEGEYYIKQGFKLLKRETVSLTV